MPFSFHDAFFSSPSNPQSMEQQQQQQLQQALNSHETSSQQPQPLPLPASPNTTPNSSDNSRGLREANGSGISDRAELIERIKAGQNPTWIPNRNLTDRYYYPNHTPTSAPRLPTDDGSHHHPSALHQGIFANESGRNAQHHAVVGSPPPAFPARLQTTFPPPPPREPSRHSSSFVLKTPTSPLVRSSNPDTDYSSSDESSRPIDISPRGAAARRKSLPPPLAPSTLQFAPTSAPHHYEWNHSPPRHHASRKLTGSSSGTASSTEPHLLPFGSFVGSYEESILNGRMSTTPSRPLNFLAQIGVLGIGKCKQSLRCPAHVSLPFPAYFYSVGDYDSPSPYVGQIDLDSLSATNPAGIPGGAYRIPQRGQLQIVIKNPNKTAVKLFLVPYDLRDMEPGTKTFIRQKSYSVGEKGIDNVEKEKEKDSLRYLIHIHIVSPSRGRYYLFKSLRVVFANRVPDGKERLRNETLWPEPKYSPWKPETAVQRSSSWTKPESYH